MQTKKTSRLGLLVALNLCLVGAPSFGQALFTEPVEFKLTQSCKATNSTKSNSGGVSLDSGSTHTAVGENRQRNPTHAYVKVGSARKWVRLSCGEYASARPPFSNPGNQQDPGGGGSQECLPFFDDKDELVTLKVGGNVDITPVAPPIDAFGEAVNQMCGEPGKQTGKTEFVMLMKEHPEMLAELMAFTGGKVYANKPATTDPDEYLQALSEAWYAIHAFDHIFCGETEGLKQIGGLHYVGRYKQLQDTGGACRLPNLKSNEVMPGVIYTMGVRMKKQNGNWLFHNTKGYGLTLSAADLLKVVTRAFAENPTSSSESTACMLDVSDDGADFKTVFVRRAAGLRTFYPDATPDAATKPCKAAISTN